jgi:hypothetical protein
MFENMISRRIHQREDIVTFREGTFPRATLPGVLLGTRNFVRRSRSGRPEGMIHLLRFSVPVEEPK